MAKDARLLDLNKNYPLVSDGKRLFAVLSKFTTSNHTVRPEMKKYFERAFAHENQRAGGNKGEAPANAIRRS